MSKLLNLVLLFTWSFAASTVAGGAAGTLNFTVLGDWGGLWFYPWESPFEHAVAEQMGKFTRSHGSQFNLGLGDNFYEHGVTDVDDPRFQDTFENVFKDESLQNPWYFLAGNHDHYGNVSAEIAYSQKSARWNFPDLYYFMSMPIPGTALTVDIAMVDTVVLCGNTKSDFIDEPPTGPENVKQAEDQWAWLEQKLQTSKGHYLIVAGHFPVWSIAEHGPTKCLVDRLMPLLHKYNVTAYMCGHDHNLQHLQYNMTEHIVDYYVIGAADVVEPSTKHMADVPPGVLKYHWADILSLGGFAHVFTSPSAMTLSFVDGMGRIVYTYKMPPRFT